MKTFGMIAEFNPFHNGHGYLIKKAKEQGAQRTVAVMSGDFVQRGEPSFFSKEAKAKAAVTQGIDLVIELPVPYSIATAEKFAECGVYLLGSLGCVDEIFFGSECGSSDVLNATVELIQSERVQADISERVKSGITFAKAREEAVRQYSEISASVLSFPNDILGVEYIKACKKYNEDLKINAIKRIGCEHDGNEIFDNFASASKLREMICSGEDASNFIPKEAFEIFDREIKNGNAVNYNKFETAVLCKLLLTDRNEIAKCPDCGEGIENRIIKNAGVVNSLDELYSAVKTKRYTHSRIRRIILESFLDITFDDLKQMPLFIHPLAMNETGQKLLGEINDRASLPVVTRAADLKRLDKQAKEQFDKSIMYSRLRRLLCT